MCGIVGVFGGFHGNTYDVFEDLLQVDVIRGPHSTGVFKVDFGGECKIAKTAGPPCLLLHSKKYKERIVTGASPQLLVGHNRFATKGEINKENAHPFRFGNTVLVHNGTIHNEEKLVPSLDDPKFNTDSETICYAIDKYGIDFVWGEMQGAAALVWWNIETRTLSMIRNIQRPLSFWYRLNDVGMVFASEDWMIKGCCARNKMHLDDAPYDINPNMLLEWTYDKGKVSYTSRLIKPAEKPKITYKGAAWYQAWQEFNNDPVYTPPPSPANEPPISSLNEFLRMPATMMSQQQFRVHYLNCCYCGNPLADEFESASIVDPVGKEAACGECTQGLYELEDSNMLMLKGL